MPAKPLSAEPVIKVKVEKTQARFKRIREVHKPDTGIGEFFFLIDITALTKDVYIPVSIASGKKPTGFIYAISGTTQGDIATTSISVSGEGVTQLTVGTIVYAKIPATKVATFRILIETRGKIGNEYNVLITQINYKQDPSDARYGKFLEALPSKSVRFT